MDITKLTAEELRAGAEQRREEAAASFERCDTDGFLSQWASGITARLYEQQAKIAEAGGTALFARDELLTLAGEKTDARLCETRYGTKWRLDSTDEWIKYGASAKALAKRGYRAIELIERAPAKAIIAGEGRGLSGAASAYISIERIDGERGWRKCIGIACDERAEEYRGAWED
jgi:hypothetical protein